MTTIVAIPQAIKDDIHTRMICYLKQTKFRNPYFKIAQQKDRNEYMYFPHEDNEACDLIFFACGECDDCVKGKACLQYPTVEDLCKIPPEEVAAVELEMDAEIIAKMRKYLKPECFK